MIASLGFPLLLVRRARTHKEEGQGCKKDEMVVRELNTKSEFNTNVNVSGHLDDLGELNGLLGRNLEILDRENLKARLADL